MEDNNRDRRPPFWRLDDALIAGLAVAAAVLLSCGVI